MHRLFGNQKWLSAFEFLKQKNTELDIWLSSKSLKGCVSVSSTFLGQIREMTSLLRCPWFSALKLSLLFSFKWPSSMTRCVSKPLFWHSVRIAFTIQDWYVFFCQNLTMHTRPTGPTYWVPCASFWLSLEWVLKARWFRMFRYYDAVRSWRRCWLKVSM